MVARYRRDLLVDQASSAATMSASIATAGHKVIMEKDEREEEERDEEERLLL